MVSSAHGPLRVALDQLLSDGAWHSLDEIAERIGPLVPPGLASRRATYLREQRRDTRASRGGASRSNRRTASVGLDAGSRDVVRNLLLRTTKYGTIERDRPGRGAMYRARP